SALGAEPDHREASHDLAVHLFDGAGSNPRLGQGSLLQRAEGRVRPGGSAASIPPLEAFLFGLLLVIAVMVVRARNLFAAVMLSSIFSLLCTGIYTLLDAVDVAFTEASVGAGISTVLFLAALSLTGDKQAERP